MWWWCIISYPVAGTEGATIQASTPQTLGPGGGMMPLHMDLLVVRLDIRSRWDNGNYASGTYGGYIAGG